MINCPSIPSHIGGQLLNFLSFPSLEEDLNVDVVIVGGGITGITSAYLLVNEGLKVAVIRSG